MYCRKPVLPIEFELLGGLKNDNDEDSNLEIYIRKMKDLKRGIYQRVHNVKISQIYQKKDYDKKRKMFENLKPGTLVLMRNTIEMEERMENSRNAIWDHTRLQNTKEKVYISFPVLKLANPSRKLTPPLPSPMPPLSELKWSTRKHKVLGSSSFSDEENPNEIVCSTPLKSEISPKLGCIISPITPSVIVLTDSPSPPPTIYSNVLNDEILGSSNLEVVKGEISPNLGCDISPSILVLTSSKSDDMSEAYWKKRPGLHESDRKTVRNGEWLTDKHINAARSNRVYKILSLQHGKYDSGINCLVQVIHINGNHLGVRFQQVLTQGNCICI